MKPIASVDLCGVLLENDSVLGTPKPGAKEFLSELSKIYTVVVIADKDVGSKWLKDNCMDYPIESQSVNGSLFIDDMALQFNGNYSDSLKQAKDFCIYWKKPVLEKAIDLSHWNVCEWDAKKRKYIMMADWKRFLADCDRQKIYHFFTKCSQGAFLDPGYHEVIENGVMNNGMNLEGIYHVYDPVVSKELQDNVFGINWDDTCEKIKRPLIPVFDVELQRTGVTPQKYLDILLTLLDRMEKRTGIIPWIYTAAWCWNSKYIKIQDMSRYKLWVANYFVNSPKIPSGWTEWKMWQYSAEREKIDGILGFADLNWLKIDAKNDFSFPLTFERDYGYISKTQ